MRNGAQMRTIVSAWVSVAVAERLNEVIRRKGTTRSAIVAWALEHFLAEHTDVVLAPPQSGFKSNRDGKDEAARAIIESDPRRTVRRIQRALADAGIRRSTGWISNARADIAGARVTRVTPRSEG
jgi:predicted DNA-binding protein